MADPRSTRLNRRADKDADLKEKQKAVEIDFGEATKRSEYLKQKLDDILDNIGRSYGKRMADELTKRLEKTILDFNGEVVHMLDKLEVLEDQRLKEIEAAKKPDPQVEAAEAESSDEEKVVTEDEFANMSDFEKRIEMLERKKKEADNAVGKSEEESDEKPKKKGFFRKKNK